MDSKLIVVDGLKATVDDMNLRNDAWSLALDQRAFGPRRLVVAFALRDGTLRTMAHCRRTDPPELALEPCIRHVGLGTDVAIAFCDEPVVEGPPPPEIADRFAEACAVAAEFRIHLVDWIACDDQMFRSFRLALFPGEPWWPDEA
jgi:hypothetical protein